MEPGLELDAGHEHAGARDDVASHQCGGAVGAHPCPARNAVQNILAGDGSAHLTSRGGIARGGLVVCHAALSIAAVTIKDRAQVQRAVERVLPQIVTGRPHGDGFGPAVGIELDVDDVTGGSFGRHRDLERDRRRGARLPLDDFLLDHCPVGRDNHVPQLEAVVRCSFRVPVSVAECVFVLDVCPDRQVEGVTVEAFGNVVHAGHAVCDDAQSAAQVREGVAQLQEVACNADGRAGLGVFRHVDGECDRDEHAGFDAHFNGRGQSLCDGRALLEGGVASVHRVADNVVCADGQSLQNKPSRGISDGLDAPGRDQQVRDGRAAVRVDGCALHASRRAVEWTVGPGGDQVGDFAGADDGMQTIADGLVDGAGFVRFASPDADVTIFHH